MCILATPYFIISGIVENILRSKNLGNSILVTKFTCSFSLDEKMDKIAERILSGIQRVENEHFQGKDLVFLNMNAKEITDIQIPTVPSLIYFKNGDPEVYPGKYF